MACFGTVQPSVPNALRKPDSLYAPATDHVNGVATPGSASPTFATLHTVVASPPSGKPRPGTCLACTIQSLSRSHANSTSHGTSSIDSSFFATLASSEMIVD